MLGVPESKLCGPPRGRPFASAQISNEGGALKSALQPAVTDVRIDCSRRNTLVTEQTLKEEQVDSVFQ